MLEELPLRRGPNVVGVLRDHVNSIGVLGNSLRLHRPDEGMHPAVLGRADIVAFLNRLKHQESTGLISGTGAARSPSTPRWCCGNAGPWVLLDRTDRWPVWIPNSPSGETTYRRCPRTMGLAAPCPIRYWLP